MSIWAQQPVTVTGTVKDADGNPMKGVTITVKATSKSTVSGTDGSFRIQVPDQKSILVFSNVGFDTQELGFGANQS